MKKIIFLILILCMGIGHAQNFWTVSQKTEKNLKANKIEFVENQSTQYQIDQNALEMVLSEAPDRFDQSSKSNVVITFPKADGTMERFEVYRASNFAPALAAKYPNINSYRGTSLDTPGNRISFSVSHLGVKTMITYLSGKTEFIEPIDTNNTHYVAYSKSNRGKSSAFECLTDDDLVIANDIHDKIESNLDADDQVLRVFRLAVSVTGEYTQYFGGEVEDALAAIDVTMARVNPIYENDFAVSMEIIPENDQIIYTDGSTDPYGGNFNAELQSTLNTVLGPDLYDVGHLFVAGGNNGNAGCIGCVCNDSNKGSAFTSANPPEGDVFDVDYVAHEMGHQFGGNHTFSRSEGTGANMEPGSGTTIMGYAGITGATDVQQSSDDYFHYYSILQITNNVKNKTCPVENPLTNNPPVADAGSNYTIPSGTAFKLIGSATDEDPNDILTYCWEQGNVSTSGSFSFPNPNSTIGPLFRSFEPSVDPVRYFPSFENVLQGNLNGTWETVSNVSRVLFFNLQVRDNIIKGGQTDSSIMNVTVVDDEGAFSLTSPTTGESLISGSTYSLTWDVAGTNVAPVNSPQVNILLSTDGGMTFTPVLDNTENDGFEDIIIPAGSSATEAYFLVESVGNIFYAVSSPFLIDFASTTTCQTFTANEAFPVNIPDGTGPNQYGPFATVSFDVPDLGEVSDINVFVDATHTWINDLQAILQSPTSNQVAFLDRECGSEDNISVIFDDDAVILECASPTQGTYAPSSPLSGFNGESTEGQWLIGIRDGFAADTGALQDATIEFCTTTFNPLNVKELDASLFSVYPNPSNNGIFAISHERVSGDIVYQVYDMTGRVINVSKNVTQLDLSNSASGVYFLEIITKEGKATKKLIKK